jgi:cytochrome b6-f complex iron-sulfur subunit
MSEQKLTTAEILAKIRSQKSGGGEAAPPAQEPAAAAAEPAPAANAPAAPAEEAPKPKPAAAKPAAGAKPTSTAGILAAVRSQGAAGAAGTSVGGASASGASTAETSKPAAAKAPAAKPGSTADILAAIRAGKSGAAPAEGTPAKPAVAARQAAPAGDAPKLSVEEMLRAVRGEAAPTSGAAATTAAAVVPAKPVVPPIPVKPAPKAKGPEKATRRSFMAVCLSPLVVAFTSMATTGLIWLLDLARYMFPNVLVEPPTRFKIGPPSDYPLGTVSTKWLAARGVWIVHTDQYKGRNLIYALASVCTHLGCTPNWLEGEQKYKCPCHGSGFYVTGINFEGPAPRPLERVGIRVAPDGQLEVDKSVKFQEEMGQWEDPNSFVDAALV